MSSVETLDTTSDLALLMRTVDFAARKHSTQRRKDKEATPYINHPIGVAKLLTDSGVTHLPTIQAALLHDTVEDTDTSPAELEAAFGPEVRRIVMECTDDKSLSKAKRKEAQELNAGKKSDEAKNVKLADKLYNCTDLARSPPVGWTVHRIQEYFEWASRVTSQCAHVNSVLAKQLDTLYREASFELDGERHKAHPSMQ